MVDYERLRPDRRLWDLATTRRLLLRHDAAPPPRPAVQVAGSSRNTTALPRCCRSLGSAAEGFITAPRGARLPLSTAVAPSA
jgi:hypothetical protein